MPYYFFENAPYNFVCLIGIKPDQMAFDYVATDELNSDDWTNIPNLLNFNAVSIVTLDSV